MNKILFKALCIIALFLYAPICFADTFTGVLTVVTEDRPAGINAKVSLALETTDTLYLLRGVSPQQVADGVGSTYKVDGELITSGVIKVNSLEIVSTTTARTAHRSASALQLLVGVFDLDGAAAGSLSSAELQDRLFTHPTRSFKKLLEQNSYGQVTVAGVTVMDRVQLALGLPDPDVRGTCFPWYSDFLAAARNSFASRGVDQSNFDRVLFILPSRAGELCNFAGVAVSSRDTLYSGSLNPTLVLHEIGHNVWPGSGVGFGHASDDPEDDGVVNNAYGDYADAMSLASPFYGFGHMEKELWWGAAGGQTRTLSGLGSDTIEIATAEVNPSTTALPQRIRVDLPGVSRPYFITYRKDVGTFDPIYIDGFLDNIVYVHRAEGNGGRNTLLVGQATQGASFTSREGPLTVEFVEKSEGRATVRVIRGEFDADGDGLSSAADPDDDNDGVMDASDCAPINPARWTTRAYIDFDNDGLPSNANLVDAVVCVGNAPNTGYTLTASPIDNCPAVSNPSQADTDNDGKGDLCDSSPGTGVTPTPNPSAPSPSGTPIPTFLGGTVKGPKLSIKIKGFGFAAAPRIECNIKPAWSSAYSPKNYIKKSSSSGLQTIGFCKATLKKKGIHTVRARACEGDVCGTAEVVVRRKN